MRGGEVHGMKVYEYKSFEEYRKAQVKANKAKVDTVWVRGSTVTLICDRILAVNPNPSFGICHGTRNGVEQKLFSDGLKCEVIGTEISDNAESFPNTVYQDFHSQCPEWWGQADFVYSNSLDHAYNPAGALSSWLPCLKDEGLLIIEWVDRLGRGPKQSTASDPFSATTEEVCQLIREAGGEIIEVKPLKYPKKTGSVLVSLIFARKAGQ